MNRSELTLQLVPGLNLTWNERVIIIQQEVNDHVTAGERIIVVDDYSRDHELFPGYNVIPFMEHNGEFRGAPPDGQSGIREVGRQRLSSLHYIVISWPAFWWLDYNSTLREHLQSKYGCILRNSRLVEYDPCDVKAENDSEIAEFECASEIA